VKKQFLVLAAGVGLVAAVATLARGWNSDQAESGSGLKSTPAPEFPDGVEWLQGGPLKLADLHGKVVVLHFWTNGCANCIHNYPVYRDWWEKYAGKGLTIIGVHTPEFAREADPKVIRAKARNNSLKYPIVLDPESRIWKAWKNQYWPSIYLIDKAGQVRYRWEGELHTDKNADKQFAGHLDELLAEKTPTARP
jgi:peroxiredoxin